jgi:hypothetical protein
LVEHPPLKRLVVGSNPTGRTNLAQNANSPSIPVDNSRLNFLNKKTDPEIYLNRLSGYFLRRFGRRGLPTPAEPVLAPAIVITSFLK